MKIDLTRQLQNLEGGPAFEAVEKKNEDGSPARREDGSPIPVDRPLTALNVVMRAINNEEGIKLEEKAARFFLWKKLRDNPAQVELAEGEPEIIRLAVGKVYPPLIYGQILELLDLAKTQDP